MYSDINWDHKSNSRGLPPVDMMRADGAHDNEVRTTQFSWETRCEEPCSDEYAALNVDYEIRCATLRTQYAVQQFPMLVDEVGCMHAPSISHMAQMLSGDDVHDFWPMPKYERMRYLLTAYDFLARATFQTSGVIPAAEHPRTHAMFVHEQPIGTAGWYYAIYEEAEGAHPSVQTFWAPSIATAIAGTRYPRRRILCGPYRYKEAAEAAWWRTEAATGREWSAEADRVADERIRSNPFVSRIVGPILPSA